MALGYILGRGSAKLVKINLNIPLALVLSVIPDVDTLIEQFDGLASVVPHRGPVHSVVLYLVVFIPVFVVYRKTALPYFIALIQHILIGDYFTGGGLELFWPITRQKFGVPIEVSSIPNISLEIFLFIVSIVLLLTTKDISKLFKPHKSNLLLAIPTFVVLLPTFLSNPIYVPTPMIPPHVIYAAIFTVSIIIELRAIVKRRT